MNKTQNTGNQISLRNFDPDKEFFVIDSDNLDRVKSELYGYCLVNGTIIKFTKKVADGETVTLHAE